jgi:hypothetical protein
METMERVFFPSFFFFFFCCPRGESADDFVGDDCFVLSFKVVGPRVGDGDNLLAAVVQQVGAFNLLDWGGIRASRSMYIKSDAQLDSCAVCFEFVLLSNSVRQSTIKFHAGKEWDAVQWRLKKAR